MQPRRQCPTHRGRPVSISLVGVAHAPGQTAALLQPAVSGIYRIRSNEFWETFLGAFESSLRITKLNWAAADERVGVGARGRAGCHASARIRGAAAQEPARVLCYGTRAESCCVQPPPGAREQGYRQHHCSVLRASKTREALMGSFVKSKLGKETARVWMLQ